MGQPRTIEIYDRDGVLLRRIATREEEGGGLRLATQAATETVTLALAICVVAVFGIVVMALGPEAFGAWVAQ